MSSKVLGNLKRGLVFILSGPTGTGKTTLMKMLNQEFPIVVQSISYTTRLPRPTETPGKDYHFVSLKEFQLMIEKDEFLEHVTLYDHHYGTSKKWVEERLKQGKHVIFVIDTQGGLQLKEQGYPATYIFLNPPSMDELRRRLSSRHTETNSMIDSRLEQVARELEQGKAYDYHITNDNLDVAYQVLKSIIIAVEHQNTAVKTN